MNKYEVIFNSAANRGGRPASQVIIGQTEDSALADSRIGRDEIQGIRFLSSAESDNSAHSFTEAASVSEETPVEVSVGVPVGVPEANEVPTEHPAFEGGGGEFGGAGASGDFSSDSSDSVDNSSDTGSDSGTSDFGSGGGEQ